MIYEGQKGRCLLRKINGCVGFLLLISLFLTLAAETSMFSEVAVNARVQFEPAAETALVYVDPLTVSMHSADYITIYVKVENATGLAGLDVKMSWDPAIITYVNHTVTIPVEDYPGGVLHKPITMIRNIVSETGIECSYNGTLCWVAYASASQTTLFPGNGTILSMTFQAVNVGSCFIELLSVDLSDKASERISSFLVDGYIEVVPFDHDLSVLLETPLHILPGNSTILNGTVLNAGLNDESSVNLELFIDNTLVNESIFISLSVNSSSIIHYIWTPFVEKSYNCTLSASSVSGETHLQNNRETKSVLVSRVITVPTDFPTIRKAIEIASPGTTIRVTSGTYYEQPVINKRLSLCGDGNPIIDGQGNSIVVQIDANESTIDGFTIRNGRRAGIFVNIASHVTIIRCYIDGVGDAGIILSIADYAAIMFNTVVDTKTGLGDHTLPSSDYSVIVGNTFSNNQVEGIGIFGIGYTLYHNSFINTSVRAPATSNWDNGEGEGNYWSDYLGEDLNGDGVGDTMLPHRGVDNYPLMKPWVSVLVGDVNLDFKVDILDLVAIARIYECTEEDPEWSPLADLARQWGRIDLFDLVTCAYHYGEKYH